MKIQCSCGAKYAFDISPESAQTPIRFVCPACGLDASDFVNKLVRQELGLPEPATVPLPPPAAATQPAPPTAPGARIRMQSPVTATAETAPAADDGPQRCFKHPDQFVADKCCVCSKPLCPKCMELFGYLCSPLCKAKAEAQGIAVPVYAGQRSVVEARARRRTARLTAAVCGLLAAVLGVWCWYAWFGSRPRVAWSVRFAEPSYSGASAFCGKGQIVFLHGDTLARYDMQLKKEIWSRHLVDEKQIDAAVAKEMKDMEAVIAKANNENPDHVPRMPNPEKLRQSMRRAAEEALELCVRGDNVWVLAPGKLTRYDRDSGNPVKEIAVPPGYGGLIPRGDELLNMDLNTGAPVITHINLTTCETRTEEIGKTPPVALAEPADAPPGSGAAAGKPGAAKAGLPIGMPEQDAGKVMDPRKVADQAQHLSYAARIALPAVLANNLNQQRTLAAADDQPAGSSPPPAAEPRSAANTSLIPTRDGFVQLSVGLLESRITTRAAMKPAPAKSALDGNLTVAKTTELANEMLNEAQRERGGDVVEEDESRYRVTIRRLDTADTWTGEVIGPPSLYPLTTVNVLAANNTVMVFDKAYKPLWQGTLSFNLRGGAGSLDAEHAPYGLGPCVERNKTLYVIDEGVLTAFDLATGNVRWRLPSVGITGLFFDDQGMIYVNSTTASPDTIKYSNQIDISQKASTVVMKLEPRSGTVLWTSQLGGLINYVSGPFIYTVHSYQADLSEESGPYTADSMLGRQSSLSIKRINPKNGHVMWEHSEERAPLDVQFDRNRIRLVFKREVEVLQFLAL